MPFTQGELITAVKLNIDNPAWRNYYLSVGDGYGSSTMTTPWFYVRFPTGRFCHVGLYTGGWFPNVSGRLDKLISLDPNAPAGDYINVWYTNKDSFDGDWEYDFYAQNYGGAGWYRVRAWGDKARHNASFYCGQNNCVQGDYLVYWDNPQNSGNRITDGTPLSVATLNSGRAGTLANM